MLTMAVYYRKPDDNEAFEKRYIEGHLPLIDKYEKIKGRSFGRFTRNLVGEVPYSHVFVGHWDDKDGWKADLSSEAATLATEDAQSFATQGFDVAVIEWLDSK
jgi:uncharacterized protein (TIGR02118 family)